MSFHPRQRTLLIGVLRVSYFFGRCWHTVPFNLWLLFVFFFRVALVRGCNVCITFYICMHIQIHLYIYCFIYTLYLSMFMHTCSEYRIDNFNYHTLRIIKMHITHWYQLAIVRDPFWLRWPCGQMQFRIIQGRLLKKKEIGIWWRASPIPLW